MNEVPKISVIVPVYNAEKTLHRCIDSILAQTFTDFELLLVNDGSKDNSGVICDEYAKRDSRIRVFHKKNGGVSSARNVGLDNVCGEWVAFVDSDDYIGNKYLSAFCNYFDADLIIGMSVMKIADNTHSYATLPYGNHTEMEHFLSLHLESWTFFVVWGKLFRSNIIRNYRFNESIRLTEDTIFVFQVLKDIKNLFVLPMHLQDTEYQYFYFPPQLGLSRKYNLSVKESVNAMLELNKAYEKLNVRLVNFEKGLAYTYYDYCKDDIPNNYQDWYTNKEVKTICLRKSSHYSIWNMIKTRILFSPICFFIHKLRFLK